MERIEIEPGEDNIPPHLPFFRRVLELLGEAESKLAVRDLKTFLYMSDSALREVKDRVRRRR